MSKQKHGTGIGWTFVPGYRGETWNPLTGCSKISPGCVKCYARRDALRWQKAGIKKYKNGFELTIHDEPKYMDIPKHWTKPRAIFVNSMSDLLHEKVPLKFIQKTFVIMNKAKQHIYLILTKRAERLFWASEFLPWQKNIWMGVSVENQKYTERINFLKKTKANIKFLSCEPLLGPIEFDFEGIDWIITGGESDNVDPREMKEEWALSIRDQCKSQGISFFHKQNGGKTKCKCCGVWGCYKLQGKEYIEFPKIVKTYEPYKQFIREQNLSQNKSLEKFL